MFEKWRNIILAVVCVAMAARPARSESNFFTSQGCSGCHTNDTPTCIGCHHHGGSSGSPGTATTNKTQYAPGETITVTLTGSNRGGWARALLYNQSNVEVARVTGPTGQGDDGTGDPKLHFPFTLTAPAPTTPGTYTWRAGWWGSPFDSNNSTVYPHGPAVLINTNTFTVAAATVTGTVSINAGAALTNSVAVTLTLSVSGSGVTQMRFSNNNSTWSAWEPYAASKAWTLAAGDGAKTVYVQFGNAAGTALANASDGITLDATAPTGTISINSGAAQTNTVAVTLTLSATGATQMRFSNNNATWSAWEAYAVSKAWTLTTGDGAKTVYVQFRDSAGNVSASFSDGITLSTATVTGSVRINGGATATSATAVQLALSFSGGTAAQMRFSNNNSTWSAWEVYGTAKAWALSAGNGVKTVYAQFGNAGGTVLASASDQITLDTTPPTGGLSINSGAAFTNSSVVRVLCTATDALSGVAKMRLSPDNTTWSAWEFFVTSTTLTLPSGDGRKTLYAQYRDGAGNASGTSSDTITLDTVLPQGSIVINGGAASTNSPAVSLTLAATDIGSGVSQMRFSNDNATWSAWEAYAQAKAWTLAPGNGLKTVYVQFRDSAGNLSATSTDDITLSGTVTISAKLTINSGALFTNSPTARLAIAVLGGSAARMRFSNDNVHWSAWIAYAASATWSMTPGDGMKTVYVQLGNASGAVIASASDTIKLDTTRPTATIKINAGAASTRSRYVVLTLTASDAGSGVPLMRLRNDGRSWGNWEPFTGRRSWTLTEQGGVRTVLLQVKDRAGNISLQAGDQILFVRDHDDGGDDGGGEDDD